MSITFSLRREKALPDIPVDIDSPRTATRHEETCLLPSYNTIKSPSSRNIESEGEMRWLHELWNEAALSARAYRRRHHGQNVTQTSAPEPMDTPSSLPSADLSTADATPPTTGGVRKRWGFFSARPVSEKQETGKKPFSVILRAIAKDRPRRKLRFAKSDPNLSDGGAALARAKLGFTVLNGAPTSRRCIRAATPEVVVQPEDNAIYFTVDPTWRTSQGSVRFQFITHIPDGPISL